jgi:hypothetical protein
MISGQKSCLTTHRDSVLLHFYLAPDMYPPSLATRNKTRHVSRLRRASCTMRGRNEDERTLLMQTKSDTTPDKDSSCHAASTSLIFETVALRVKSY